MSDLAHSPQNAGMNRKPRRTYVSAGTALVAMVCTMGCLNLNFGGQTTTNQVDDPSVLSQHGTMPIPKGQEATVYYPKPYASPPNLELEDHHYKIIEQQADHFRVRNESTNTDVKWTARGVPVQPASAATPSSSTPTATAAAKP